ncbi:MAG: phosphate ABC transporter substrate-binding protein [Oligoflexales bacterium]
MKFLWPIILVACLSPSPLQAKVFVIANSKMEIKKVSKKEIRKLFLGKTNRLGDVRALPINQNQHKEVYEKFSDIVLGKSIKQLERYWARKIFTGQGLPAQAKDDVVRYVSENPNTISYTQMKPKKGVLIIAEFK